MRRSRSRLISALGVTLLTGCGIDNQPTSPHQAVRSGTAPRDLVGEASATSVPSITIRVSIFTVDGNPSPAVIPFTTDGKKLHNFKLDDNNGTALASSITFSRLKPGDYTVQGPVLLTVSSTTTLLLNTIICQIANGVTTAGSQFTGITPIPLSATETIDCTYHYSTSVTG